MKLRFPLLAALCALSLACPKRTPTNVSGSDDEQLDQFSSKLEELKGRVQASEPACGDWCSMAKTVCDISRRTCDIAARKLDRQDVQDKCVGSQEDCAQFNDRCAHCGH